MGKWLHICKWMLQMCNVCLVSQTAADIIRYGRFAVKRYDYRKESFTRVSVCGIECEFNDIRIERSSVPEGKYQYEIGGDDDSGDEPVRVSMGVLVNFFGTLISDEALPIGGDGALWLMDGDFVWL